MLVAYPAIIHFEEDQYWAEFPDVPGCFTVGDTLPEVMAYASESLGGLLCCNMDHGISINPPSDPTSIHPEDGFVSLVVTDPLKYKKDTRAVKKTLSIPAWLNEEAEKRHINFSSVLQSALIDML